MRYALTLILLFPAFIATSQKNIRLRSMLPYRVELSNLWGYADSDGNEYALVGAYNGLSVVDVTNPDSIRELFFVPGPENNWREIKTWNNHAYATNERSDGLLIVDLNFLPDSIHYMYWTGDSALNNAHTLFIDENGILYLFGYNNIAKNIPFDNRGALICDLNADPENPMILGAYSTDYVHDGFVRNDTLWASQISRGNFAVIDVSDKANPAIITTQETPNRFTHNAWLSDGGDYLFTTDERSGAFITSYDVSDLENITEVDRWQAASGSGLIPHNTHFLNNYLITSYYKYGINILDVSNPAHLVEVGYYDTSPYPNADGFSGCWGVYPYLPSGTILASDIETGLYVLKPDYQRACYLRGVVTDDSTGSTVGDLSVEIMGTGTIDYTSAQGFYKTGTADSGRYDVRFYKDNCPPVIVTGVHLQQGVVTTLNVALRCIYPPVSVHDVANHQISATAYPTVFNGNTTIRYVLQEVQMKEAYLQIVDVNGRALHTLPLRDREGSVIIGNDLAPGIYLLRLANASFAKTLRVVKAG